MIRLDLQQAEAGAVRVQVRVDQPGYDRTTAAVDDPVARLRAPAHFDDHARCDPDATFAQLGRIAVEDHRVGKGRGLLAHSRIISAAGNRGSSRCPGRLATSASSQAQCPDGAAHRDRDHAFQRYGRLDAVAGPARRRLRRPLVGPAQAAAQRLRRVPGTEMGTEGDSFFVVFASAVDAVSACAEGQRAGRSWPRPCTGWPSCCCSKARPPRRKTP